jgi:type I restriction enzyme R subunit
MSLTESIVEDAALTWFGELGYAVGHGPQIAPGEAAAERGTFGEVILTGRLRRAIVRFKSAIPESHTIAMLQPKLFSGKIILETKHF